MNNEVDLVGQILQRYGTLMVEKTKQILKDNDKDASNRLISSIRFENIKVLGFNYQFKIIMEDYGRFVESGRKQGAKLPSEQPILEWIKDKGLKLPSKQLSLLNKEKTKGKNKGKAYTKEELFKSFAFGIRKNISKKGIKPVKFYSSVVNEELMNNLKEEISKAIAKDIMISFETLI